jgi:hypothetical protein
MKQTIRSTDYKAVYAESFDVLVDPKPRYPAKPVIALKVDPFRRRWGDVHYAHRV